MVECTFTFMKMVECTFTYMKNCLMYFYLYENGRMYFYLYENLSNVLLLIWGTQMIIVGTLTSRALCRFLMSLFTYKFADKGS